MIVRGKNGTAVDVKTLDILSTKWSDRPGIAVAIVNKHVSEAQYIELEFGGLEGQAVLYTLNGPSENSYNDIDNKQVEIVRRNLGQAAGKLSLEIQPHSVNVLQI